MARSSEEVEASGRVAERLDGADRLPRLSWTVATVVYKLAVPFLVLTAVLLLVIAWLPDFAFSGDDLGISAPLIVPLVGLAPFALLAWFGVRLKDVRPSEDGLVVSNFLKRTTVPYSQVCGIRQAGLLEYYVTLTLESPCAFGPSIHFFADPHWFVPRLDGLHPAVFWLARRCGHTRVDRGWLGGRATSRAADAPGDSGPPPRRDGASSDAGI